MHIYIYISYICILYQSHSCGAYGWNESWISQCVFHSSHPCMSCMVYLYLLIHHDKKQPCYHVIHHELPCYHGRQMLHDIHHDGIFTMSVDISSVTWILYPPGNEHISHPVFGALLRGWEGQPNLGCPKEVRIKGSPSMPPPSKKVGQINPLILTNPTKTSKWNTAITSQIWSIWAPHIALQKKTSARKAPPRKTPTFAKGWG